MSTFVYFAYGSNLLAKRIHINNPTAVRRGIGRLKDFRLDFTRYSERWRGASATIVPTPDAHVWGAIWEIDLSNLDDLDRQEGVDDAIYFPLDVDVESAAGETVKCRVYQQCNNPREYVHVAELPEERQPSLVYLTTIFKGAEESGIPTPYIDYLKSIRHNGYAGEIDIGLALNEI
ncbi:gamma-glutamylcyclotransferase [Diachasma alloeum]|uniref:gamma-glutamylcyclotransferase n=1 Tax=Diachasma alloeum TaxID=454923 RepID=UPI0007383DD5|nr:gamma-glutamylcyclotransferase [Diachasma alloeum]